MQALIALEAVSKFSLNNKEVNYQKGIAYFELELYNYAIENFIQYALDNNDDPMVYFLIGKSFMKINDYVSAIGSFEKSLSISILWG